jgi:serine protease Do
MSDQWYFRANASEFGPYSAAQLRQFAHAGRITAKTLVRDGNHADWIPASLVRGLIDTVDQPSSAKVASPPPVPPRPGFSSSVPSVRVERRLPPDRVRRSKSRWMIAISIALALVLVIIVLWVALGRMTKGEVVAAAPVAANVAAAQEEPVAPDHAVPAQAALTLPNANIKLEPPGRALSTEEIVAECEAAVALIKGRASSGTGFIVAPNLLVTNKHVLSEEFIDNVQVYFPSAKGTDVGPFKATLVAEDVTRDLAVIRVETHLKPLRLAPNFEFRRGQEITVIGSPGIGDHVLQNAVSRGVMSTETTIRGLPYYQMGVSINPGNSGGPAFDSHAQVIGVVTLKAAKQEGLAFCIPATEVRRLVNHVPSLTQRDTDLMQSNHRARVAYSSIAFTSQNYKAGMQIYVSAMANAIEHHADVNEGLSAVRDKVQSKLRAYDDLTRLRREIQKIATDSNLTEATRQKLADFWVNHLEIKSYIDNPRGNYNSYHAKCNELSDTYDRLSESLKTLLSVSDDD